MLAVVALAALAGLAAWSGLAAADDQPAPCCFTNARYEGVCQVTPGAEESCAGILAYLNNPMSSGKTYCGGTKIRGGWKHVDCEANTRR